MCMPEISLCLSYLHGGHLVLRDNPPNVSCRRAVSGAVMGLASAMEAMLRPCAGALKGVAKKASNAAVRLFDRLSIVLQI